MTGEVRLAFALFPTAIGECAIVWNERGVCGVVLPEADAAATRRRTQSLFPGAVESPPGQEARAAIEGMSALLGGEPVCLREIVLDMTGVPAFHRDVYEFIRGIPPGETMSYGEIAEKLGGRDRARAVGQAMARNPFPILVPCHRVLAAHREMGGFSAPGGVATKLRLLRIEGVRVEEQLSLFS